MADDTTDTNTATTTSIPKWIELCSWLSTSLAAVAAWMSTSTYASHVWVVVVAAVLTATAKFAGKIYADKTDDGKLNWSTNWF